MSKKKGGLLAAFLIAAGVILYFFVLGHNSKNSADLPVSGNIEVTTVDLAFKISGKIENLLVDEGDQVKAGALVASLEHKDLLAQRAKAVATLEATESRVPALMKNIELQDQSTLQEVSQAQSSMEAARARLEQLLTGSRPQEIQQAKAMLEQAQSDLAKRKADMDRAQSLFQNHYISAQDWDSAKNAYEVAAATRKKAEESYGLVVEGPRQEEIAAARAQWQQSQAGLKLARAHRIQVDVLKRELATARAQVQEAAKAIEVIDTQIEYSNLIAPLSAVVLVKNTEAGEFVVPGGPVITLGDIEKPWLKAYIHEGELGKVKLGQKVSVVTDSYPGKTYPGKITFISSEAEFTPKNVQTPKERVKLVYRIKVSLENPHRELKPGMPADATIHTN